MGSDIVQVKQARAWWPELHISRMDGRPYWQVEYRDGKVVSEWTRQRKVMPDGTVGFALNDWKDLPKEGRRELRFFCPDGSVAILGNTASAVGRLLQFKVAVRSAAVSLVGDRTPEHETRMSIAMVVGMVSPHATCTQCEASRLARMIELQQTIGEFRSLGLRPEEHERELQALASGKCEADVYGGDGHAICWAWEYPGRFVHFHDNKYNFRRHQVGRLSAEHLGMDE